MLALDIVDFINALHCQSKKALRITERCFYILHGLFPIVLIVYASFRFEFAFYHRFRRSLDSRRHRDGFFVSYAETLCPLAVFEISQNDRQDDLSLPEMPSDGTKESILYLCASEEDYLIYYVKECEENRFDFI